MSQNECFFKFKTVIDEEKSSETQTQFFDWHIVQDFLPSKLVSEWQLHATFPYSIIESSEPKGKFLQI
jgi:hypothetical protein